MTAPHLIVADALEQLAAVLRTLPAQVRSEGGVEHEWVSEPEALRLIGGDMRVTTLRRLTRGLSWRKDLSRKTVRYERRGLLRWLETR